MLDVLSIQFIIFLVLFFIYFSVDLFFLILNSTFFLFLLAVYTWNFEGDLFINFLIIIDLGLYFLFYVFFLHYSNLFTAVSKLTTSLYNISYYVILAIFLFFMPAEISAGLEIYLILHNQISFYNWYSILNLLFSADLQFLAELYFGFNFTEFILMNFYIYIVLLLVYYLISTTSIVLFIITICSHISLNTLSYSTFSALLKYQDLERQKNTTEAVRVWSNRTLS